MILIPITQSDDLQHYNEYEYELLTWCKYTLLMKFGSHAFNNFVTIQRNVWELIVCLTTIIIMD